jgi:hypothetical protein
MVLLWISTVVSPRWTYWLEVVTVLVTLQELISAPQATTHNSPAKINNNFLIDSHFSQKLPKINPKFPMGIISQQIIVPFRAKNCQQLSTTIMDTISPKCPKINKNHWVLG